MEHDVTETGQMAVQLWGNSAVQLWRNSTSSEMCLQLFRLLTADPSHWLQKKLWLSQASGSVLTMTQLKAKRSRWYQEIYYGMFDEEPHKSVYSLSSFQWHRCRHTL